MVHAAVSPRVSDAAFSMSDSPVAARTQKDWAQALGDAIKPSPIGKMFGMGKKTSRTSVVEKVAEPEPAAAAPVRRSSRLRN